MQIMARRHLLVFSSARRLSASFTSTSLDELWGKVIAGIHPADETNHKHHIDTLKNHLGTGISTNKDRPQTLLPDEATSWFKHFYSTLEKDEKARFFNAVATEFSINHEEIDTAVAHWNEIQSRTATAATPEVSLRAAERLYQASQPLYNRLWAPLAQHKDGISFLVQLRGDLLNCIHRHPKGAAPLRIMAQGLHNTLSNWFSITLLHLKRLSWEGSSAAMLEKIAVGEKVHKIANMKDLKQRLDPAKGRVYVWTHSSLPGEPLIALYVALCPRIAQNMEEIFSAKESSSRETHPPPTTAVFYSISSMQPGLAGVDLGNNLIKRVVKELQKEVPSIFQFATLSPLPGFAAWLDYKLALIEPLSSSSSSVFSQLLLPDEVAALENLLLLKERNENGAVTPPDQKLLLETALTKLKAHHHHHHHAEEEEEEDKDSVALESALKAPLMRLAAHYLLRERHRRRALDPVANFHLRNGAAVHRLNWKADSQRNSCYGIMVNYVYDMDAVEENNKRYLLDGEIAASSEVMSLLRD